MVRLRVNGRERPFDGDQSMPLLWYLRDELALTETKYGCGVALCGCRAGTVGDRRASHFLSCVATVVDVAVAFRDQLARLRIAPSTAPVRRRGRPGARA
jgi:isoquinoline 1-oxidoreductase subunit alpha